MGLLQFLAVHTAANGLPRRLTFTPKDRYLTDLLVRHFQAVSARRVAFLDWTKARDAGLRATVEEAPLLGVRPLYVVLGAPKGWAASVEPARDAFLLVEEPEGKLQGEEHGWRDLGLLFAVLRGLYGFTWALDDLKRADWSWATGWADYEPFLVRAWLLGWDAARLARESQARMAADLFSLIRDRRWGELDRLSTRYGRPWLYRHLVEFTLTVVKFHQLKARNFKAKQIERMIGLPRWRYEHVRDAAGDVDLKRCRRLAARIVQLDPLVARDPGRGMDLLMAGADL